MARPLRIEYPGACYHVMNRGNDRREIYHHDRDYELFIEKLGNFSEAYHVKMRSYCLMPNHFHLYFCIPEGNLSKFMQSLLTSYTVSKNRRDRCSGHLFQGRFRSLLVEDESYGSTVSRYIHLNPVKLKSMNDIEFTERVRFLHEYKWSSYVSLIGLCKRPKWLDGKSILCRWGGRLKEQQRNYREYVEERLIGDIDDPFEVAAARCILGSESFVDTYRRNLATLSEKPNFLGEQVQAKKISSWVQFESLVSFISEVYKVRSEDLLIPYQRGSEARQILIYLALKYCRGRYSLTEISQKLGMTLGGLSSRRYKLNQMCKSDNSFRKQVNFLEKQLGTLKVK